VKVAVVKYKAGNIQSVLFALNRLGIEPIWTDNPEEIANADKVILPGVGQAGTAMQSLQDSEISELIPILTQPLLGICVGMQLLCASSEENNTKCIGVFDAEVVKFAGDLKIPQIGWNQISSLSSPLFDGIPEKSYVYFVHSYHAKKSDHSIATTSYGQTFSSALSKDNFYGVQFHVEKSGEVGEQILNNFLKL